MKTRIQSNGSDRVACEHVHASLAEYLERRERALLEDEWDRAIAAHLGACSDCRALYQEIAVIAGAALRSNIPRAKAYPNPDLSFLPGRAPEVQPPIWQEALGSFIIILAELRQAVCQQSRFGTVTRGALLYRYISEANLSVTIDVLGDRTPADQATVVIRVRVPGISPFEQDGTQVVINSNSQTRLAITNSLGTVVFSEIPSAELAPLRVEITPRPPPSIGATDQ